MTTHNGQRVLVTAGAGGIGRAIVRAFAEQGARVHACDIDEAALTALRAEVEASLRKVDSLVNDLNRKWPFSRDAEIVLP
mgnify:CR=1 FL=1